MRAAAAAFVLVAVAALLASCSEPLPPEKLGYAGQWRAVNVLLVITPEGSVAYKRQDGKSSVSINAPIQRFEGNNFVVGIGPLHTTFVVSQPPHLVDGQYRMTVDGVELTRVSAFEGTQA